MNLDPRMQIMIDRNGDELRPYTDAEFEAKFPVGSVLNYRRRTDKHTIKRALVVEFVVDTRLGTMCVHLGFSRRETSELYRDFEWFDGELDNESNTWNGTWQPFGVVMTEEEFGETLDDDER